MSKIISYEECYEKVKKALLNAGLSEEKAEICARVHTESSADGVESHGLNRVPRFVDYVKKGWVDPDGEIELVKAHGAAENYDGNLGVGITNALYASNRAVELAEEHGIGMVTLKNTTHWMRGGTYAWNIAEKGYMGISWINSESCMPMWGSDEEGVGNNPFCMAIPREKGPVILDMAMSQYAYGKLGVYRLKGEQLPYPGGFDKDGNLTTDPGAIEDSRRILPIGYWKGSGMSLCLDLAASVLANGKTGIDMDEENKGSCTSCCQIFIAIDPYMFGDKKELDDKIEKRLEAVGSSSRIDENRKVTYPGERTMERRKKSKEEGIKVDEKIWEQIEQIASGNLDIVDIAST